MSLIAELKRRNVFRVGVAYAIVAWLLIEMAQRLTFPILTASRLGSVTLLVTVLIGADRIPTGIDRCLGV